MPIAIGVVVVAAVAILIRASLDFDEPGTDKSAQAGGVPRTATRDRKPAQSALTPFTVVPTGAAAESASEREVPPVAAPSTPPATAAGPPPAPGPPPPPEEARPTPAASGVAHASHASSAGASAAAKEAARGGGPAYGQSGGATNLGAGGAGDARPVIQKVALKSDAGKREPVWQRPPAGEDSAARLVARLATTGGATLKGRVIEYDTGKPVMGIAVEAHVGDSYMRTATDGAGNFRMSGVLPSRRITVWILGTSDTFVAERLDVTSPGEGETVDAGLVRLLRGDELAGHLEGWMGVFVSRRGRRNVVAAVSPWSPADRAGIQVGDILLSIEGRDVDGLGPRATGFLLRGPVGTKAALAVQNRDGVALRYQLERVLR